MPTTHVTRLSHAPKSSCHKACDIQWALWAKLADLQPGLERIFKRNVSKLSMGRKIPNFFSMLGGSKLSKLSITFSKIKWSKIIAKLLIFLLIQQNYQNFIDKYKSNLISYRLQFLQFSTKFRYHCNLISFASLRYFSLETACPKCK